jgi:hypothetical protein
MKENHSFGQGAIEYLLIIGAAVIIAVIVIALMMTLAQQGTTATEEADVKDIYHDLKVNLRGYEIEIIAGDNSGYGGTATDASDLCKSVGDERYCSWPISNYETIFGGTVSCFSTNAEITLRLENLDTGEVETKVFSVSGINSRERVNEFGTFKYTYKGDPNARHNLKSLFTDCCYSINTTTGQKGCNLSGATYSYDKNMKVDSVTVKNSDGKEIGHQEVTECYSSSLNLPCYNIDFQ